VNSNNQDLARRNRNGNAVTYPDKHEDSAAILAKNSGVPADHDVLLRAVAGVLRSDP
jgi:hypothetical protein